MKKLFVVFGFTALLFAFASCNKHCVCTVTKDGQTLEEYDFSDQELNRDECTSKVDDIMHTWMNSGASSNDLIGVSVKCEHL